ncbi:hypothetical protein [Croceitalea rosinachiae]|uniref:Uncharacterized protein n=1 Tax=Croceitalea rosinachiae TaxID=3075596 RepID=A0ABU3AEG0_9FLAO|nr:hypothetical protein [Croceitalea sp. F388]MDT0607907.1 hypothetical protein [Croceitalea sp. F388]
MKNSENAKQVVFIIGFIALLIGVFGAIASQSLMAYFFPIYTGFILIGTALMHKEKSSKELVR